jgi:hypothetical protein
VAKDGSRVVEPTITRQLGESDDGRQVRVGHGGKARKNLRSCDGDLKWVRGVVGEAAENGLGTAKDGDAPASH